MPVNAPLANLETGVMFWANREPAEVLAELHGLGVRCGQLGLPGELDLSCANAWKAALRAADFTVYTVFAGFIGESYADIPTVTDTVGFMPRRYRVEREQRTLAVSDFARVIGASSVGLHIGCVPDDDTDEDYVAVREMVRRVADHVAKNGQSLALETGQEPAEALLSFIIDVNRDNLGINFDPANMILYGTGDPIEALGVLGQHVMSVHCKDGDWPPADQPGALGTERALGSGAVGIERYLQALKHIGYKGPLAVEREAEDPEQRLIDIRTGIALLERVKQSL
ncbi:MAG: Xylose isomerase domain protein barrel [Bryobacterales bacterium]|nr:Xylose isomerase domain protein barrel [Bryobacterales bacterium]